MNHARPVTRLAVDGLASLPWIRSSIALGRPYKPQYRFREVHPPSSRAAHSFARGNRSEHGQLDRTRDSSSRRRIGTFFDTWEKSDGDGAQYMATGQPTGEEEESDHKLVSSVKNTLALAHDRCLHWEFDHRVAVEEGRVQGRTVNEVYSILRVAAGEGTISSMCKVQACVSYLINELGEKPNLRLYAALLLVNCRADGSIAEVQRLLQEMHEEEYELDIGACHDVLKVLSVHPDYLLRTELLQYMQSKWFQLTDSGWHDVVAGLIREGSLEMAMDKIEEMEKQGIRILGWLHDMMIYALVEREELDEVLWLIRHRIGEGDMNISGTMWYYLLDLAGQTLHYDLASYIWRARVKPQYLNPSAGLCLNLMTIAARHGDTELAQDVFGFLSQRNTTFEAQHYELMIEAYARANMPSQGLHVLSAMQQAGVTPHAGTVRELFFWLEKRDSDMLDTMFAELKDMKERNQPVPPAAMGVLIEAATAHENLDQAMTFYKAIREICDVPADLATFNILFKLCRLQKRKDIAFMLASEMVAMRITPDALTYDRMMLVCLQDEDYEDALRYYEEMRAKGFEPRFRSALHIVRTLTKHADERIDQVLDQLRDTSLPLRIPELRRWVKDNFGNTELRPN